MKHVILRKAWVLDNSNLEEAWFHDCGIVYYGTRGQAKNLAITDNNAGKLLNGDDITFLTIKVKRSPENDEILYNYSKIKRYRIKELNRKEIIKKLPKDKFFYVQDSRSYVGNAVLWWAKDGSGYVTDISKAHKYTWEEIQTFNPRETDIIWESELAEKAIRSYVDSQYLDYSFSL